MNLRRPSQKCDATSRPGSNGRSLSSRLLQPSAAQNDRAKAWGATQRPEFDVASMERTAQIELAAMGCRIVCDDDSVLDLVRLRYAGFLADESQAHFSIFVDVIEESWHKGEPPLQMYAAGTWGPLSADLLLASDGRGWHHP